MNNNTNEKSLVIIKKKNIFSRIFDFFSKHLNKNKYNDELNNNNNLEMNSINTVNDVQTDNSFRENISIDRLEKLFIDYRKGIVKEEEINEADKIELIKKYKEKINMEKQQIEYYKNKIIEIRNLQFKNVNSN